MTEDNVGDGGENRNKQISYYKYNYEHFVNRQW